MCWPISPSFIVTAVEKKPLHLFNKCGDASPHRPQNGLAVDFIVSTRGGYLTRQRLRRWLKIGICRFSTVLTIQISGLPSLCPERPALTVGRGSAGKTKVLRPAQGEADSPPGLAGQAPGSGGKNSINRNGRAARASEKARAACFWSGCSGQAGHPF